MNEQSKLSNCNCDAIFYKFHVNSVYSFYDLIRTISWKKFKTMVQQNYNDDMNQLNTIIKHLQNLWNQTRNLIGNINCMIFKYFWNENDLSFFLNENR